MSDLEVIFRPYRVFEIGDGKKRKKKRFVKVKGKKFLYKEPIYAKINRKRTLFSNNNLEKAFQGYFNNIKGDIAQIQVANTYNFLKDELDKTSKKLNSQIDEIKKNETILKNDMTVLKEKGLNKNDIEVINESVNSVNSVNREISSESDPSEPIKENKETQIDENNIIKENKETQIDENDNDNPNFRVKLFRYLEKSGDVDLIKNIQGSTDLQKFIINYAKTKKKNEVLKNDLEQLRKSKEFLEDKYQNITDHQVYLADKRSKSDTKGKKGIPVSRILPNIFPEGLLETLNKQYNTEMSKKLQKSALWGKLEFGKKKITDPKELETIPLIAEDEKGKSKEVVKIFRQINKRMNDEKSKSDDFDYDSSQSSSLGIIEKKNKRVTTKQPDNDEESSDTIEFKKVMAKNAKQKRDFTKSVIMNNTEFYDEDDKDYIETISKINLDNQSMDTLAQKILPELGNVKPKNELHAIKTIVEIMNKPEDTNIKDLPFPKKEKGVDYRESIPSFDMTLESKNTSQGAGEYYKNGLYNYQIDNFLRPVRDVINYYGCVPFDEISKLLKLINTNKFCFVFNTASINDGPNVQHHWCAINCDGYSLEIYDPLGNPPKKELTDMLHKYVANHYDTYLKFKTNANKVDQGGSKNCGWYCMRFLIARNLWDVPFDRITGFRGIASHEKNIDCMKENYKMFGFI
jgi:hypothetical protein